MPGSQLSRRSFVRAGHGALAGAWTGVGCSPPDPKTPLSYGFGSSAEVAHRPLPPTPACDDGSAPVTTSEIEGPFYTPRTPRRASLLEPSSEGRRLGLVGRVLDTGCRPVPGAVLDSWQADAKGDYDNEGFRLRGHQFADGDGLFGLETIVPGSYSTGWFVRTPHLHVKVQGAATRLLTTQLYFPEFAAQNRDDGLFHPELLMTEIGASRADALLLRFDFVLAGVSGAS